MSTDTTAPAVYHTPCGVDVAADTDGFHLLTPCCQAGGKGSVSGQTPVIVCRGCYRPVPHQYGDVFTTRRLPQALTAASGRRCPIPDDCATETIWHLIGDTPPDAQ